MSRVDVKHAMAQADVALGVASLPENDIFRRELREASAAVGKLVAESKSSVAELRKHAKQVHDLPLLQQDLRRLANRIERRIAAIGPQS